MLGSRRIAQKIFLGYLLTLTVLTVAGLIVPIFLAALLGRVARSYEGTVRLVDQVYDLRRAANDSENNVRGFILYRDESFRQQYIEARNLYRVRIRDVTAFADENPESGLSPLLSGVDIAYRDWVVGTASPEMSRRTQRAARSVFARQVAAFQCSENFEPVAASLTSLVDAATRYRDQQLVRARFSEGLRITFTLGAPVVALLMAVLMGRSISLGITRPLEQLTRAAEELEQGNTTQFVLDDADYGEDEVGEMGRAFSRMARTIGQREAVLRTQNEALGAIGRRFEAVLNATNDGIVLLDTGGGFSLVNHRFGDLFGVESDLLLDQTFEQASPLLLSRFKNRAAVRDRFRELLSDPVSTANLTFDIVEPAPRTLRIYSAPVHRGAGEEESEELLGRIFVFRDVTQETIVDRMKTEFVSTVSHELRTPLTAIRGYVDLMVSGKTGPVTGVQREFLTMVQASTRRLTNLINDLLDVSRIESGRMTVRRETVQYLPLVRDALRMMANEAEKRSVTLQFEAPEDTASIPPVSGDADRIIQVLVNLISNGIKYTHPGGSVTVRVVPEEAVVTTSVADTGIGISEEDQAKLFQKFFRADNSTTRDAGGTGLGLAITKAILDRMRGSIHVDSAPGAGSRFVFTLPSAGDTPAAASPVVTTIPFGDAQPEHRGLVLIVDETPALLHLVSQQFRRAGYVTSGATRADEALRRARDLHPDAIVLNTGEHPRSFGIFTLLRATPATRRVPLALISLRRNAGDLSQPMRVEVLASPVRPEALGAAVRVLARDAVGRVPRVLVVGGGETDADSGDAPRREEFPPGFDVVWTASAVDVHRQLADRAPDVLVLDCRKLGPEQSEAGALMAALEPVFRAGRTVGMVLLCPDEMLTGEDAGPVFSLAPGDGERIALEDLPERVSAVALRAAAAAETVAESSPPKEPAGNVG